MSGVLAWRLGGIDLFYWVHDDNILHFNAQIATSLDMGIRILWNHYTARSSCRRS